MPVISYLLWCFVQPICARVGFPPWPRTALSGREGHEVQTNSWMLSRTMSIELLVRPRHPVVLSVMACTRGNQRRGVRCATHIALVWEDSACAVADGLAVRVTGPRTHASRFLTWGLAGRDRRSRCGQVEDVLAVMLSQLCELRCWLGRQQQVNCLHDGIAHRRVALECNLFMHVC
jgi:hypothetical protein